MNKEMAALCLVGKQDIATSVALGFGVTIVLHIGSIMDDEDGGWCFLVGPAHFLEGDSEEEAGMCWWCMWWAS
jgi:hypothetical protein